MLDARESSVSNCSSLNTRSVDVQSRCGCLSAVRVCRTFAIRMDQPSCTMLKGEGHVGLIVEANR